MKFSISKIQKLLEEKMILAKADEILKGIAYGKTMEDIYKRYPGVEKEKLDHEYELGKETEFEHTEYPEISEKILIDHLWESPTYYTDLKKHVEKDKKIDEARKFIEQELDEEEDEDIKTEQYERNIENSNNLHDILSHEELVDIVKYVRLVYEYPVAEKIEAHHDSTETESRYYIGKVDQDIVIKKRRIILKSGYYSIEKMVDTIPKIEPRAFMGSYETPDECIENLINALIDLENSSENISITIKNLEHEIE